MNITYCVYNGQTKSENEEVDSKGAKFKCVKKNDRFEWDWQSGGECKLKDNSMLSVNQTKVDGGITYHCIASGLSIVAVVESTDNEIELHVAKNENFKSALKKAFEIFYVV